MDEAAGGEGATNEMGFPAAMSRQAFLTDIQQSPLTLGYCTDLISAIESAQNSILWSAVDDSRIARTALHIHIHKQMLLYEFLRNPFYIRLNSTAHGVDFIRNINSQRPPLLCFTKMKLNPE